MGSSPRKVPRKVVVDSIHGDIHLKDREVQVIDTPSFQRLRQLKQLAMAQMVYPSATHTRFAHSVGALGTMIRILEGGKENNINIKKEERDNLRLAALLHDVGHYPYSHLMERVDSVELIEEQISSTGKKTLNVKREPYPEHEETGTWIVEQQPDLRDALGGKERAKAVADLFTRTRAEDLQLSKLIHSSLDLDRLDYLLRDSHATGVPYGNIDINYLLSNLSISPSGVVGFTQKALPAVEQFLFARFFMHQVVYYHKTTYGLEEACRQLLRRLRDRKKSYGVPANGNEIREIVTSHRIFTFTDAFLDRVISQAAEDKDECIKCLACCIQSRRPPKLLKEVSVCEKAETKYHAGKTFMSNCRGDIEGLSKKFKLKLWQFLLCSNPPLKLLKIQPTLTARQAKKLGTGQMKDQAEKEEEEDIKIFRKGATEPDSLITFENTLIARCANYAFQSFRLYVVLREGEDENITSKLQKEVENWDKP
jgi:HD superfamily phosphohydrolase